jgi:acyl dehydratase
MTSRIFKDIKEGEALPRLPIDANASLITAAAIATRDYQDVHHDRNAANAAAMPQVFMNILTTNGLISRYITDWAGPAARIRQVNTRLGVPTFAGATLTFSGQVTAKRPDPADPRMGLVEIQVSGTNALGEHASSTVTVAVPNGSAA